MKGDILWTRIVTGTMMIRETGIIKTTRETGIATIRETVTRTIVRTGRTRTTATGKDSINVLKNCTAPANKPAGHPATNKKPNKAS